MRGSQGERELTRRKRPRAERAERRAVVVGERRELPAEVWDVGREVGRGAAAMGVKQRRVADDLAGDAADPRVAQPGDELGCGRSVSLFPHAIEGAVAERGVTRAAQ